MCLLGPLNKLLDLKQLNKIHEVVRQLLFILCPFCFFEEKMSLRRLIEDMMTEAPGGSSASKVLVPMMSQFDIEELELTLDAEKPGSPVKFSISIKKPVKKNAEDLARLEKEFQEEVNKEWFSSSN